MIDYLFWILTLSPNSGKQETALADALKMHSRLRGNDSVFDGNDMVFRGNDSVFRGNGMVFRGNDMVFVMPD